MVVEHEVEAREAHRRQAPAAGQPRAGGGTGQAQYRQRSALVEPGFAQLFQRFGRHLNYRGRDAVDTELKHLGTAHNLNKLLSHTARTRS
ncbi:transposase [Streptomyces sp. NPDC058424]|uniref:transposase n=1 Tax=Streptomyces sp. NPDC058424 TaxID=3346491 RepID=UPI00366514AD